MKQHEILAEVHRLIDEQVEALRNRNRLIDEQMEAVRNKLSASQAKEIARRQEKINQLLKRISRGGNAESIKGISTAPANVIEEGDLPAPK